MLLTGAPEVVVIDQAARSGEVERLLQALELRVVTGDAHELTLGLGCPSVGVFLHDRPPIAGCYAWYVGTATCPTWMQPAAGQAALVLSLLGTGMAQERAGAAFRAAGRGQPPPTSTAYDGPAILAGITRAASPGRPGAARSYGWEPGSRDALLAAAFEAIDRCCSPNGAIAAAPPRTSPSDPDYSFFWQRDAAAVAFSLLGLVRSGPPALRGPARERLNGYVDFVTELGRHGSLSASRFTLAGDVVGGYGDPQHDGPAATALLLLQVAPQSALPYLRHLQMVDEVGFDLWELVQGRSYHALSLRRRALGSDLDLDPRVHVHEPDPPWFAAVSRLDMSSVGCDLLGSAVLATDAEATLAALESAFAGRWPVNLAWAAAGRRGHGLGRFPEDCNDGQGSTGGHPWPVTTLWAAQWHLRHGERELGEGYLDFVLAHGAAGHEQIDGVTGLGRGTPGLAWSAAELINTLLLVDR